MRWVRVHRPPAAAKRATAKARRRAGRRTPTTGGQRTRTARAAIPCCACGWRAIRFLLQLVDRHPEWKSALAQDAALSAARFARPAPFRDDRPAAGVWVLGRGGASHGSQAAARASGVRRSRTGVRRAVPGPGRRDDAACVADGDARARPGVIPLRRGAGRSLLDGGAAGSSTTPSSCFGAGGRHRTRPTRSAAARARSRSRARRSWRSVRSRRSVSRSGCHARRAVRRECRACAARRGNHPVRPRSTT